MKRIFLILCFFSCKYVTAQTADFSFTTPGGLSCAPVTVSFTQTSTGNPIGFKWDFGNNNQSNASNPSFTFVAPGAYQVTLTSFYSQSSSSVTKTVVINPPATISASVDKNYLCNPGLVNFTASGGVNVVSYDWDFGDGSPVVTTANASIPYTYAAFGNFTAHVKATESTGCFAIDSVKVKILAPVITASVFPPGGCVPIVTNFNASVSLPATSSVINYQWDFGDGSPFSNTVAGNTSHTYIAVGNDNAVLTITTNDGCTASFNFPTIFLGVPPGNVSALVQHDSICGGDSIKATASATNVTSYRWIWGDGDTLTTNALTSFHSYQSLGPEVIRLTPFYNRCPGKTISIPVFVKDVIANFNYTNSCSNKSTFNFSNASQGNISTIQWDFGDGNTANGIFNTSHTYQNSGTYKTFLKISDNITGCSDFLSRTLYTAIPSLSSNITAACKGSNIQYTINNNYNNPAAIYTWNINGTIHGPTNSSTINLISDSLGAFTNFVIIDNGPAYCKDTVIQQQVVKIGGPLPAFNLPAEICQSTSLKVSNTSTPFFPSDAIVNCQWSFGEANGFIDNNKQPAAYNYANSGTYAVKLKATDLNGCTDTLTHFVKVDPVPYIKIIPGADTICAGTTSTLIALHSDSLQWIPANLVNCSTCDTVITTPASTTQFFAVAKNIFGCSSTDSSLVNIILPFKAIPAFTDTAICPKDTIQLDVNPKNKTILWSPANSLSASNIFTPTAYPLQTTVYSAIASDSTGCSSDTAYINVRVKSLPIVNAGPDQTYAYNTTYNLQPSYSANIIAYQWSPGTLLNCTNCATPAGKATYSETYTIKVTSDSGCVAADTITIFVDCPSGGLLMPTAFTPNNDNINDLYYPVARAIKTINRFMIFNRVGQLVFKKEKFPANDTAFGWDGKYGGTNQPSGTYIFVVEADCDGKPVSTKGSFVLIR